MRWYMKLCTKRSTSVNPREGWNMQSVCLHGAGANVLAPGVSLVIRGVLRNLERGCKTLTRARRSKQMFRSPPFPHPPPAYRAVENIISNSEKKVHLLIRKDQNKQPTDYRAMNIKRVVQKNRGAKKVEVRNKEGCEKRRVRCTPFFINGGACCLCTPPLSTPLLVNNVFHIILICI